MSFWTWLTGLFGRRLPAEKRLVSLVLLLREERYLDAAILRQLATEASGTEFDDSEEAENFVVMVRDDANFMIRDRGQMFLVNNYPKPYIEDMDQVRDNIKELRLRRAVLEHRAWLSVDRFGPSAMSDDDAFRWIGRLIAELLDDECSAIFCPANSAGCANEDGIDKILRSREPLRIFEATNRPPVLAISDDDPRMVQAVHEARSRWPQFVKAFEERQPGEVFAVKAPLSDGGTTEFMWLSVGALENNMIYGRLDNDPINLGNIKCGDRVRVCVDDLNDWLYTQRKQKHGGFTVAVLTNRFRKGQ